MTNTAISIKVVHERSGKVEYEREMLLGISKELMNFHSDSQQPFALVLDFSALLDSQGPVYEFVRISFRTDNLNCFRVS